MAKSARATERVDEAKLVSLLRRSASFVVALRLVELWPLLVRSPRGL
jgi:hypothetical protein